MYHFAINASLKIIDWIFKWRGNFSSLEKFLSVIIENSGYFNQLVFIRLRSRLCLLAREWRNLNGGVFVFVLFDSCVVTIRPGWESGDRPTMKGTRR